MDRTKLRDRLATASVVVTVVAVIGVTNALAAGRGSGTGPLPVPEPVPVVTRQVGYGHAAIAVPKLWGTNLSRCGVPRRDTVLIDDPSAVGDCDLPRPDGVSSVELATAPPVGFRVDETFSLNGVRAERSWTSCSDDDVCWGAVGLPSLKVWFRASSSRSAAEVDQILSRVAVLPDRVGVPSAQSLDGTAYAEQLRRLGLRVEFRSRTSVVYKSGRLVGVSPPPGTMLPVGASVTVTVAK